MTKVMKSSVLRRLLHTACAGGFEVSAYALARPAPTATAYPIALDELMGAAALTVALG